MKPNSYQLRSPQTVSFSRHSHPSVPISVYRQVVEELKVTKIELSAMKANNQQLQQEVEKLMQSAQRTQQLVRQSTPQSSSTTKRNKVKPIWQANSWDSSREQQVVTVKYAPRSTSRQQNKSQEINGWVLAIAIIVIILTAFTSGFLLVRPLLDNNNHN